MAKHENRLSFFIEREYQRICKSEPNDLDLSKVQARSLVWLPLLVEALENNNKDIKNKSDSEAAMGRFAVSVRLKDSISFT